MSSAMLQTLDPRGGNAPDSRALSMEDFARSIDVAGVATRFFEQGDGPRQVLLVHGGACSGLIRSNALVWERNFSAFALHARSLAVEMLGQGETDALGPDGPSFPETVAHLAGFIAATGLDRPHIVGHDEGGLAALTLGLTRPDLVASVTLTGSCAAPSGDALPNLTLSGAPAPFLSRASQAWALERVSYANHHVYDGRFLDEAVRLARAAPRDEAARASTLRKSVSRARSECFTLLRDRGIARPILLAWGLDDPLVPFDNAVALYRLATPLQRAAQLASLNQAGNMPFREQPTAFNRAVISFILAQS